MAQLMAQLMAHRMAQRMPQLMAHRMAQRMPQLVARRVARAHHRKISWRGSSLRAMLKPAVE